MSTVTVGGRCKCTCCGQWMFVARAYDDEPYCADCWAREFATCDLCKQYDRRADMVELADGSLLCSDCSGNSAPCDNCGDMYILEALTQYDRLWYCPQCAENLLHECVNCGELVHEDDATWYNDEPYCSECADDLLTYCYACESTIHNDDAIIGADDNSYCESCWSEQFTVCSACLTTIWAEDSVMVHDEPYCPDCAPGNTLHSYSYKPKPDYQYLKNETKRFDAGNLLFLGVELEMEAGDWDIISSILDTMPSVFYAKEDGSLCDGLELVTHPMSWAWMKKHADVWKILNEFKRAGCKSYKTNTCGLHVHLSKSAFSSLHLYKFLKFFYENPSFIQKVSHRSSYSMERWSDVRHGGEYLVYKAKHKDGNTSRYTAVNLRPHKTVEVRIFKGTLSVKGLWKRLEFVHAAYEWTQNISIKDVTVQNFLKWVEEHKKAYPYLAEFLTKERFNYWRNN